MSVIAVLRTCRRAMLASLWLVAGTAFAFDLTVDPAGGPLTLEEDVEIALADWRAAGVDVEGVEVEVTVRYGDAARFGPDALAWVLLRPQADGAVRLFEVLVAPEAESIRSALIPAFGLVLGGAFGRGAFDPIIDPAGPRRPTPADGTALEARRSAVPGDLNRDGRVDFEDLLVMATAYGQRGVNLLADLNGDGVVDDADLDLLRARYRFDPPAAGD